MEKLRYKIVLGEIVEIDFKEELLKEISTFLNKLIKLIEDLKESE